MIDYTPIGEIREYRPPLRLFKPYTAYYVCYRDNSDDNIVISKSFTSRDKAVLWLARHGVKRIRKVELKD